MRWLRAYNRYPLRELARRTGVTQTTVKRWRSRGRIPESHERVLSELRENSTPWPKYLDKYPDKTIAERVGVSPATVARWRKRGVYPSDRTKAVRSVKSITILTDSQRRKMLSEKSPESLAKEAGVSVSLVKRWQKKGDIPLKHRSFLTDSRVSRKTIKKLKPLPESLPNDFRIKETKHWVLFDLWWDLELELSDSTVLAITHMLDVYVPPDGDFFQFYWYLSAMLRDDDEVLVRYNVMQYEIGTPTNEESPYEVEVYATLHSHYVDAVDALRNSVLEWMVNDSSIEALHLVVRKRK